MLPAERDERNEGWVRISEKLREEIKNRTYVEIRRKGEQERAILCQVRGTPDKTGVIRMNEWYREALGWHDLPSNFSESIELLVEPVGWRGRLTALLTHPNDTIRVGFGLGLIGIGLGLAGTAFGISVYASGLFRTGTPAWIWGLANIVALAYFLPGLYLLVRGIKAALGDPTKGKD